LGGSELILALLDHLFELRRLLKLELTHSPADVFVFNLLVEKQLVQGAALVDL